MLSLLLALLLPKPEAPTLVAGAGQQITLAVQYPQGALLNRQAPNVLRLSTPWQVQHVRPKGTPHPDRALADYFGQVSPMHLNVKVPPQTPPGVYPAKLSASLFVCDQAERLCTRRDLNFALSIRVQKTGERPFQAVQWFKLRPSDLRAPGLKR